MYSNIYDFFTSNIEKTEEEKKNMIHEMVDIMDMDQLSEVINFLKEPYFSKKLKQYLINDMLPSIKSPEFLFLLHLAKYNGNLVKKFARENKLSDYYIDKFINKYSLKEVSKGIYVFPENEIDGNFVFQAQYTRSVISHETALYMHDLSDVIPRKTIMSMPISYKLSQVEKNERKYIKVHKETLDSNRTYYIVEYYQNDPIYLIKNQPIGNSQIQLMNTHQGNEVKVTSIERTIADIFKPSSNVEEEIKETALERYSKRKNYDKTRLLRISKQQNVEKEIEHTLWKLKLH
ncbi:type IV toxin-antitoxin system AbiEi family antitoxin domain-containing protein [Lactococcus garvieae]|uniref:type IV toxin-antitoxin system AbiEi family antitoxin domain-containing protein n=1 Tax=Lactococcus garvieae TaxID=1363 RepID=UPI00385556BF